MPPRALRQDGANGTGLVSRAVFLYTFLYTSSPYHICEMPERLVVNGLGQTRSVCGLLTRGAGGVLQFMSVTANMMVSSVNLLSPGANKS